MNRIAIAPAALAVAGLLSLTACARPGTTEAAAPAADPSPVTSIDAPPEAARPELAVRAVETPDPPSTPVPEPTVAKTQKWVKIYSGASAKDLTAPRSIRSGSKTVELNTEENDDIGTYVTDGAGRTLYRFDEDDNKPPRATCNGACAKTWPPLLIKSPGKIFPDGIDPTILGYVERADGHCQVTINGWPVYYFSGDKKAGDINGQGVKGTWFAVSPTGGKTKALPPAAPAPDSGTGGSAVPPEGN
ncbi:lipoprotein [Actinoplanes sp. N902-109]|uniref:COG4315 family predicted lipoprotein n=1 Tax=Actinoplanes sp. (strain N902-109) TaxID=649831 RepID=UPI0003295E0B|nr:lipoprotein [Actinoplanes sp. N902-109]AGL14073.1 lipoprotein [Actinoplanes sp. N902-109]